MAMLPIDIRRFREGPVRTDISIPPDDPAIADLGLHLTGPVRLEGDLRASLGEDFRWVARMEATVAGDCRRCLTPLEQVVDQHLEVIFSSNPDFLEDPSVYALPPNPVAIDLTDPVREELALAVSAFPLCRPDCRGLCARCGADLNAGPCGCAPSSTN